MNGNVDKFLIFLKKVKILDYDQEVLIQLFYHLDCTYLSRVHETSHGENNILFSELRNKMHTF